MKRARRNRGATFKAHVALAAVKATSLFGHCKWPSLAIPSFQTAHGATVATPASAGRECRESRDWVGRLTHEYF